MGEFKTQERILGVLPTMRQSIDGGLTWTHYGALDARLAPSQHTESYRTSVSDRDAISESEVRDFLTVTYNGLRETNPTYDTGHEFYTTKTWTRFSHPKWKVYTVNSSGNRVYRKGPLVPRNNNVDSSLANGYHPAAPRLTDTEVNTYGARAIKATEPTNSIANLSTFIGETLEALPAVVGASLLESRTQMFRSLGGEYLNVQFGWAPFISDIRKTLYAVKSFHKITRQYARDSGRVVRRRFAFPTETSSSLSGDIRRSGTSLWIYNGDNPSWYTNGVSPVFLENTKARDIWFSGAFQYYLDPGDSLLGRLDRYAALADHLLGIKITPEVLWELTPWSWLVDWVADVGTVLSNASSMSSNGLVMKYGYLMCHTREFNRFIIPDGVVFKYGVKTGPIYSLFGRETKERRKATPYGFGIDPGSFSAFQWSILGALGLTKAPGILH